MNILVPTDFSSCAQHAATLAIKVAQLFNAKITYIHLMSIPIDWTHLEQDQTKRLYPDITAKVSQANNKLQELCDHTQSQDVACNYHTHYNESRDFILEFATSKHIDLVIMGSHGSKGIRELFLGTNTQKVVRDADIPVIVVKHEVSSIQKIAFVSDFGENIKGFNDTVKRLADELKADIHLLYVNTPFAFFDSRTIHKRMITFTERFPIVDAKNIHIYNDYQIETGIKHFCEDNNVDLIVMGTHGKKGIDRFFSGSLTENVINHLKIPVLSLPIEVREIV